MKINIILNILILFLISSNVYSQPPKFDYGFLLIKKVIVWVVINGMVMVDLVMEEQLYHLRETGLDREQLITIIACGRPGTNMPFFDKKAYVDDRCFGMKFSDFEGDDKNRPLQAKSYLNQRQIEAVVDFIINDLQGQKVSKDYCVKVLW